jgi:hypothetical protein
MKSPPHFVFIFYNDFVFFRLGAQKIRQTQYCTLCTLCTVLDRKLCNTVPKIASCKIAAMFQYYSESP